ncbi:MAG TPA: RNB domain-containing ribonuclease [Bryobacteraceae bacterium]
MPLTFDLAASARQEMLNQGFNPDFPPTANAELNAIAAKALPAPSVGLQDLRSLAWSSIDNDDSKDLDQIEAAERTDAGIRVRIGIADVDWAVTLGTALDQHAQSQTTTVYSGVTVFPMLPERLSTDLTSLNDEQDRVAVIIEFTVSPNDGSVGAHAVYPALVRNKAQLMYSEVGPWLEGTGPVPAKIAGHDDLIDQLKMQDEASKLLLDARHRLGALDFDRVETESVTVNGHVEIRARRKNRAGELIEDFMVAANSVMARTLGDAGVSSIRRVVKAPERWPRIVELAQQHGTKLPDQPDAGALNQFLQARKAADPAHYADVSLAVLKLMGPGEYVLLKAGEASEGHFGLAAHDYTHSTAPNRRFADVVTQRILKAVQAKAAAPYNDDALQAIAQNCTLKEDAARKVERNMQKRIAAVALSSHIGQQFKAVVTGVVPHKGVFVRIIDPPAEGRLMRGEQGLDVGDQIVVRLLAADRARGFIDFARVG